MANSDIPVDLLNPGQVFACLGILEAADVLLSDAEAAFDWNDSEQGATFRVTAADAEPPVARVLRFLKEASVVTRAPADSANLSDWKPSWGEQPEVDNPDAPFPFPDPGSPATLPVVLRDDDGHEVMLDYWGDATRRDNVKFWAGSGGYPGAAIVRDALKIIREKMRDESASDPFELSGVQSSSLRFDWRRDYIPLQDGFSPNKHGDIQMVGFPLVEILAAIGVSHARPKRHSKLEYRYGVLGLDDGSLLSPIFHRAALGAKATPVPGRSFRRFVMCLDWPGREGDARCITQVSPVP